MSEIVGNPDYKVIELQAENEHLKDKLIEQLEHRVYFLEQELTNTNKLLMDAVGKLHPVMTEQDSGSNMIAPPNFVNRPRIRTTSELSALLETQSKKKVELPISAEDLNENSSS